MRSPVKGVAVGLLLGWSSTLGAHQDFDLDAIVQRGVDRILEMQEGDDQAEWPYEGVYRVAREIPYGYRVGGTSICSLAVMQAPGFADNEARGAAVDRAQQFVVDSIHHEEMAHEIGRTYDVRGWGYAYGLLFLLERKKSEQISKQSRKDVEKAIRFFLTGIEKTSIPQDGGWNYSRRNGFDEPGSMSPFMTATTLQALYLAKEMKYEVPRKIIDSGMDALEKARTEQGGYVYSGTSERRNARSAVPGAVARMAAAESSLLMGGRGSVDRVRSAVDAFIVHWGRLEERRAKHGTHEGDYGVAPYYFYFGHFYAAQAVELLPEVERREYRRHLDRLLMKTHQEDSTWNDRVFQRSANYGTAMAVSAILQRDLP